jgi:hypothetical protein
MRQKEACGKTERTMNQRGTAACSKREQEPINEPTGTCGHRDGNRVNTVNQRQKEPCRNRKNHEPLRGSSMFSERARTHFMNRSGPLCTLQIAVDF